MRAANKYTLRVFLPFAVAGNDRAGFRDRFATFLDLAAERAMLVMPILFDDCAFAGREPYLGAQREPLPGVHNSGWTPSPGPRVADDPKCDGILAAYVSGTVAVFRDDTRILAWDIYNEPGNDGRGNRSLPLLESAFDWARDASPTQSVIAAVWNPMLTDLNRVSLALSDVSSFHSYASWERTRGEIETCRRAEPGRPVLCMEWMSRTLGSR